jgi:hypothetical protein
MNYNKLCQQYNPIIDDIILENSEHAYTILHKHFNTKDNIKNKIINSYYDALQEQHIELSTLLYDNYNGKIGIDLS